MRVLITGGATGIGKGIADAFAKAGAEVIAPPIGELDVTSQEEVTRVIGGIGTLDALINCAGILRRDEEFEMEAFEQVIDINLTGTMRMCVAAKPKLMESKGSIVNIASMLSYSEVRACPPIQQAKERWRS